MKKWIASFVMLVMLSVMIPLSANAQTYYTKSYDRRGRARYTRVVKKPSFYRRHRNLINVGVGTGAGALIGGLAGGKKGLLIGSLIGAGGSALYTYKNKPKKRRY